MPRHIAQTLFKLTAAYAEAYDGTIGWEEQDLTPPWDAAFEAWVLLVTSTETGNAGGAT